MISKEWHTSVSRILNPISSRRQPPRGATINCCVLYTRRSKLQVVCQNCRMGSGTKTSQVIVSRCEIGFLQMLVVKWNTLRSQLRWIENWYFITFQLHAAFLDSLRVLRTEKSREDVKNMTDDIGLAIFVICNWPQQQFRNHFCQCSANCCSDFQTGEEKLMKLKVFRKMLYFDFLEMAQLLEDNLEITGLGNYRVDTAFCNNCKVEV